MAERIAIEKARLKKLEQQLAERLRQFGKETDTKEGKPSTEQARDNIGSKTASKGKGPTTAAAKAGLANLPKADVSKDQTLDKTCEKMEVTEHEGGASGDDTKTLGAKLGIDSKQLDYVKTLQVRVFLVRL